MATPGSRLAWLLAAPLGLVGCGYAPNPLLLAGNDSSTSSGSEIGETSDDETGDSTTTTTSTSMTSTSATTSSTSQTSDPTQTDTSGETEACAPGELDCSCDAGECDEGLVCEAEVCVPGPVCGDGVVEGEEQCDDGNSVSADGCDSDCQPTEVVALAAGGNHTCALTEAGDLICWGFNANGRLGYGNQDNIGDDEGPGTGGRVPLSERVAAVSVGGAHTCALLESSKTVTCWGANPDGRLGLGHTDDIGDDETPDSIQALDFGVQITSVSAGSNSTCARSLASEVFCWGENDVGQLGLAHTDPIGNNEAVNAGNSKVEVGNVAQVGVGSGHACAIMSSGGVRCWGQNSYGQLGYGNTGQIGDNEHPNSKTPSFNGDSISGLSLGADHTLVLHTEGAPQVRGWGRNHNGQLGVSNTVNYGDNGISYATANTGTIMTALASGAHHVCALVHDGNVLCWGLNSQGQLGIGSVDTIGDNEYPYTVMELSFFAPAVQVVAGSEHSCALLDTGDVQCWGTNEEGQIGLGVAGTVGDNELATAVEPVALF